ncbi:EcsC family protein [Nakamurella panacisegetis]|uniref:EcsC family protein n=1 Tax=Nakamurella panacisegetis TaxID=1090615 RepID=UPI001E31B289|nr:EcsC family protein [Nakamurella panacisegetis]
MAGSIGGEVAKRMAPAITGSAVRDVLERAIDGVGPVPSAAQSGDNALRRAGGNVDQAIDTLIGQHVKMAGAQGFLTNVGGLLTMALTVPANIAAVSLLQCHLSATILHLRGYDLASPSVRDAVLVCLLDGDARKALSKSTKLTMSAAALATAVPDQAVQAELAKAVTGQLLAMSGGKQMAKFVARRIPVLGGAVGGIGDAFSTRRIGRDAARTPLAPTGPRRVVARSR